MPHLTITPQVRVTNMPTLLYLRRLRLVMGKLIWTPRSCKKTKIAIAHLSGKYLKVLSIFPNQLFFQCPSYTKLKTAALVTFLFDLRSSSIFSRSCLLLALARAQKKTTTTSAHNSCGDICARLKFATQATTGQHTLSQGHDTPNWHNTRRTVAEC